MSAILINKINEQGQPEPIQIRSRAIMATKVENGITMVQIQIGAVTEMISVQETEAEIWEMVDIIEGGS